MCSYGTNHLRGTKNKLWCTSGISTWSYTFTVYVYDFAKHILDCHVIQYADDDLIHRSEETLNNSMKYFYQKVIILNTKKMQCMFLSSKKYVSEIPPGTSLKIGDSNITYAYILKILGMHFDSQLAFVKHVSDICRRTYGTLMFINRIKESLSKNARTIAIQSLV